MITLCYIMLTSTHQRGPGDVALPPDRRRFRWRADGLRTGARSRVQRDQRGGGSARRAGDRDRVTRRDHAADGDRGQHAATAVQRLP